MHSEALLCWKSRTGIKLTGHQQCHYFWALRRSEALTLQLINALCLGPKQRFVCTVPAWLLGTSRTSFSLLKKTWREKKICWFSLVIWNTMNKYQVNIKKQMASRKLKLIVVMFDGRPYFFNFFIFFRSWTGVHWISLILYYRKKTISRDVFRWSDSDENVLF